MRARTSAHANLGASGSLRDAPYLEAVASSTGTSPATQLRAPDANAIGERLIGTLRRECLDHMIVINERHLRHVLGEYACHYNGMRPHRSLSLDAPEGRPRGTRALGDRLQQRAFLWAA